jgi:hypothetical protein
MPMPVANFQLYDLIKYESQETLSDRCHMSHCFEITPN